MDQWIAQRLMRMKKLPLRFRDNIGMYGYDSLKQISLQLGVSPGLKTEMLRDLLDGPGSAKALVRRYRELSDHRKTLLALAARETSINSFALMRLAHVHGIPDVRNHLIGLIKELMLAVRWFHSKSDTFNLRQFDPTSPVFELFVPKPLAAEARKFTIRRPDYSDPGEPIEGSRHFPDPTFVLREIELMLHYIAEEPVELTQAGKVMVRYVKRMLKSIRPLSPELDEQAAERRIDFFRYNGFLHEHEKSLSLDPDGFDWLSAPTSRRVADLFAMHHRPGFNVRQLPYFQDLMRSDRLIPGPETHDMRLDIRTDWSFLPPLFAALPDTQWVRVADMAAAAGAGYPFLFFTPTAYSRFAKSPPAEPSAKQFSLQRSVLAGYIEDVLFPLGLVEWAIGQSKELLVRPTPLGRAALSGKRIPDDVDLIETPGAAAPGPALIIQPNFELLAFGDRLTLGELAGLRRMAGTHGEPSAATPVINLRLGKESIHWALGHGSNLFDLTEKLEALSGAPLPANIITELREWAGALDRVTLYRGYEVLEFATARGAEKAADTIKGARVIAPLLVLAPKGRMKAAETLDYGKPLTISLTAKADGSLIRNPGECADLGLHGFLAGIAEEEEDGRWRITKNSIGKSGLSPSGILAGLERRAGKIPPELHTRIVGFSGRAGALPMKNRLLVQITDPVIFKAIIRNGDCRRILDGALEGKYLLLDPKRKKDFLAVLDTMGLSADAALPLEIGESGSVAADEAAGEDLSGFRMLTGKARLSALQDAAANRQAIEILFIPSGYYNRSTRLLRGRGMVESIYESRNPEVLFQFTGHRDREYIPVRMIKAIRTGD